MKENEVSVTFHADKDLIKNFEKAIIKKAQKIGVMMTKKQALNLAVKEATEKWNKE